MTSFRPLAGAALILAAALGLSACETATPYRPLDPAHAYEGGYKDVQIESNRFRISFSGNSSTSRETVERYLLFRSAELTLAQGYDWFAAADRSVDKKTEVYATPSPFGCGYGGWCGGYWGPHWRYYRRGVWGAWDPWMDQPLELNEVSEYTASAEIILGKGPKPANDPRAFDARDVLTHLSAGVQRPKP
jgi:hypothetical protein